MLKRVIDQIRDGFFNPYAPELFHNITDNLLVHGDRFCLLADYEAYIEAQDRVSQQFRDEREWTRKCILNTAASGRLSLGHVCFVCPLLIDPVGSACALGFFSSDRSIKQYAAEIWHAKPHPRLDDGSSEVLISTD